MSKKIYRKPKRHIVTDELYFDSVVNDIAFHKLKLANEEARTIKFEVELGRKEVDLKYKSNRTKADFQKDLRMHKQGVEVIKGNIASLQETLDRLELERNEAVVNGKT